MIDKGRFGKESPPGEYPEKFKVLSSQMIDCRGYQMPHDCPRAIASHGRVSLHKKATIAVRIIYHSAREIEIRPCVPPVGNKEKKAASRKAKESIIPTRRTES